MATLTDRNARTKGDMRNGTSNRVWILFSVGV